MVTNFTSFSLPFNFRHIRVEWLPLTQILDLRPSFPGLAVNRTFEMPTGTWIYNYASPFFSPGGGAAHSWASVLGFSSFIFNVGSQNSCTVISVLADALFLPEQQQWKFLQNLCWWRGLRGNAMSIPRWCRRENLCCTELLKNLNPTKYRCLPVNSKK